MQIRLLNVGEDQVLFVAHANLAEAVAVGQVGDDLHLVRGCVAGRTADRLEGQIDDGIAGPGVGNVLVRNHRAKSGSAARLASKA